MHRGEIWLVNLDPTLGAEIKNTRPAVIVSSDLLGRLPLRIIVPVTEWKERYAISPWLVRLEPDTANGLSKLSAADAFQLRSISEKCFVRKVGKLDELFIHQICQAAASVLEIE